MDVKEKLAQFFEEEKIFIEENFLFETDDERKNKILLMKFKHRAYGAVELAIMCGLDSDTAEKMFYDYYDRLEEKIK